MTSASARAAPNRLVHNLKALTIGGHVPLGRKPRETLDSMRELGFACLQIHAASPRTWRIPAKPDRALFDLRDACAAARMDIYLHGIYLINLASEQESIYEASIRSLSWNLQTGAKLGAKALVFHVGSHLGRGLDKSRPHIAAAIERILSAAPSGPPLLIENSAGAGACIGGNFQDLGRIMADAGRPPNLGICVDTAHAFAMGHDPRTPDGVASLLEAIDDSVGLSRLKLMHLNDSKVDAGAARDRHENIGRGFIGETGFRNLLASPVIRRLPLILETPNLERRPEELRLLLALSEPAREAA